MGDGCKERILCLDLVRDLFDVFAVGEPHSDIVGLWYDAGNQLRRPVNVVEDGVHEVVHDCVTGVTHTLDMEIFRVKIRQYRRVSYHSILNVPN